MFPYDLPIWRASHRAASPDGNQWAEVVDTMEVSMGNPRLGVLRASIGLHLQKCNPAFIWSDDSRYIAIPQFRFFCGLQLKQRLLVIDTVDRKVFASRGIAPYIQPESFVSGRLIVSANPHHNKRTIEFAVPDVLSSFRLLPAMWL